MTKGRPSAEHTPGNCGSTARDSLPLSRDNSHASALPNTRSSHADRRAPVPPLLLLGRQSPPPPSATTDALPPSWSLVPGNRPCPCTSRCFLSPSRSEEHTS